MSRVRKKMLTLILDAFRTFHKSALLFDTISNPRQMRNSYLIQPSKIMMRFFVDQNRQIKVEIWECRSHRYCDHMWVLTKHFVCAWSGSAWTQAIYSARMMRRACVRACECARPKLTHLCGDLLQSCLRLPHVSGSHRHSSRIPGIPHAAEFHNWEPTGGSCWRWRQSEIKFGY